MRYLITVSYDGSKFQGFQRLKNKMGIQGIIESAISKIAKSGVEIKGAGRTDRGVHAYAQKCHFDLKVEMEPENLRRAINGLVGDYIYIKDCKRVDDDFHARFDVKEKEYIYKINIGDYDPMIQDYTLQIDAKLDLNKMKKASKLFVGKHDFSSFVSGKRENFKTTIKTVNFIMYGDILYIIIKGQSFFRYMVRNIVGALIEVGRGKVEISDIADLLNNPKEEVKLPTAYPQGLYLFDIKY